MLFTCIYCIQCTNFVFLYLKNHFSDFTHNTIKPKLKTKTKAWTFVCDYSLLLCLWLAWLDQKQTNKCNKKLCDVPERIKLTKQNTIKLDEMVHETPSHIHVFDKKQFGYCRVKKSKQNYCLKNSPLFTDFSV